VKQTSLYIPVNIKTRHEFFDGYGFAELPPTVAAALVSGFAAFVVHALTGGTILPVLIVLVTIAAAVTALAKGENNMSVVDWTKCVLRFEKEQKQYPYCYTDEWRDEF
jgi:hypothetical protein